VNKSFADIFNPRSEDIGQRHSVLVFADVGLSICV
jgi:hypothetical protein